jgi:hypothetical protein
MTMQAWLDSDEQGRQFLVRTGTGVVSAVVPVGIAEPDESHALYRVEIYCDAPHGRPGAIRYSTHPVVSSEDPLFALARRALDEVWAVGWTVQWHRHDWVPADLPISSLNLATDARATLAGLDRVSLPEPVDMDIDVPAFLPAGWMDEPR